MQPPSSRSFTTSPGSRRGPRIPRRGGLIALLLFLVAVGAAAVGRSYESSTATESRKPADRTQERPQPQADVVTRPAQSVALIEQSPERSAGTRGAPAVPVPAVRLLADAAYAPALDALLADATRSVDVTIFSCVLPTDAKATHSVRKILDRLVQMSKSGVRVRVVFDHGIPASRLKDGDAPPSENAALYLADRGVDVRWDEDARTTHSKSLVVDGRWCMVGSTNWSYSALNKNREQSVLIDSLKLANELTVHFEGLWRVGRPVAHTSK